MVERITVGMLQEHAYLWIDETTKHGFLIDPGAEADKIKQFIEEKGYHIEKILITHGHFDHIGAAKKLREALGAPIIIHQEGRAYLEDPQLNLSSQFGMTIVLSADEYVEHESIIVLEANTSKKLQVIYAPGHTQDGVAFYSEQDHLALVGDIIFEGSVGRSDFPGGNGSRLLKSIQEQIFTLPDDTILYPGHGNPTTVKKERETNPVFNFYDQY